MKRGRWARGTRSVALSVALAAIVAGSSQAASPAPAADPGPDPGWIEGACQGLVLLDAGAERVTTLGYAAGQEDLVTLAAQADEAATIGDAALATLDAIPGDWPPGRPLIAALADGSFALVDLGVGLSQADMEDAETLRAGLAAAIRVLVARDAAQIAFRALPEDVAAACASVPLPPILAPADPLPSPSPEPTDPVLAAAFPATIDGALVEASTITGPGILSRTDAEDLSGQERIALLEALLTERGLPLDALSVGFALVVPPEGAGATITAIRIAGEDAETFVDAASDVLSVDYFEPIREQVTVGGRTLTRISDGPWDPEGVFEVLLPAGDIVWSVSAADPLLARIVETLAAAAP